MTKTIENEDIGGNHVSNSFDKFYYFNKLRFVHVPFLNIFISGCSVLKKILFLDVPFLKLFISGSSVFETICSQKLRLILNIFNFFIHILFLINAILQCLTNFYIIATWSYIHSGDVMRGVVYYRVCCAVSLFSQSS